MNSTTIYTKKDSLYRYIALTALGSLLLGMELSQLIYKTPSFSLLTFVLAIIMVVTTIIGFVMLINNKK